MTVPQAQPNFTWTTNLEPLRTYSFVVYAVDAAGNRSNNSNEVTVRLAPDTMAPSTPAVSVTEVGPTHAKLAFVSTDDGPFTWYTVFKNGAPIAQGLADEFATAHLLEPSTSYSFSVQARDFGANWSPMSSPVVVTTPPADPNDTTPPSVPTNLYEDHAGDGEILLQWAASTDDVDPQGLIRYDVLVNGVVNDIAVGRTRSIVYGVDGSNTLAVVARDAAGNASAPATLTVVLDL